MHITFANREFLSELDVKYLVRSVLGCVLKIKNENKGFCPNSPPGGQNVFPAMSFFNDSQPW